jgi:hypothetical protein
MKAPDTRLSRREVTGRYVVKYYDEACTSWNYDANEDDNLCHKSIPQTKSPTPMHESKWRINETKYVLKASAI